MDVSSHQHVYSIDVEGKDVGGRWTRKKLRCSWLKVSERVEFSTLAQSR